MKIRLLIMFKLLLTLFGCSKGPKSTTVSSSIGPFTLETITTTGKTWNINYGRVDYSNLSYNVKYKGQPLSFDGQLEQNTALPGIWRVFVLKDAPVPALILGSQALFLVTEESGKAQVKPLNKQYSDFGSIQWLDSDQGLPGIFREVFSSDQYDTDNELRGGRYMAITNAVVLDTKTFEVFPFNENNNLVDGFYKSGKEAIAFSPDSTQLIFYGSRQDENDYSIVTHALLSYNFRTGTTYGVPFDKSTMWSDDTYAISREWVDDFFEWTKQEDGTYRLINKAQKEPVYKKGALVYYRNQGYIYILAPVKDTMIQYVLSFILQEFKLTQDKIVSAGIEFANKTYITIDDKKFVLEFGYYGNDIRIVEENVKFYTEANKNIMARIGKGFNALLGEGQYQDAWMTDTESNQE